MYNIHIYVVYMKCIPSPLANRFMNPKDDAMAAAVACDWPNSYEGMYEGYECEGYEG